MDQTETREFLLSDRILVNGTRTAVTFTTDGILRWEDHGTFRLLVIEKDVLGFSTHGSQIKIKTLVERDTGICFGSNGILARKCYIFEPLSPESFQCWCHKLQEYIDSLGRPKKLFIFVNPFGGSKSASKIFVDDVKPLLEDANIEYTIQETEYQLHAKEVAKTMDLSKYDGVVCVSGDGILVEVVNGLLEREDWEAALRTPLGLVPAGTGNGMIKSLLDSAGDPCTAAHAVLTSIRGHKRQLDIATILQGETKFFSVLMLAWGLIADIDIESEKYRWLGVARLDIYALQRIFRLRKYNGSIFFVPAPGFENIGEPSSQSLDLVKLQEQGYQGPKLDTESLNWRKLSGPFVSVWLHNVPWGSETTKAAPDAQFSDGYLDMVVMKDCPKLALLSLMTEMGNGGHVKSPHVMYIKVKAFILEPGSRIDDPKKEGIIDSDGEVLARGNGTYNCEQKSLMAYDKIQITVDQGLVTLFSPPI